MSDLRRQVVQTFVIRGVMVLVSLVAAVVTVRVLGRDAFGVYALINLTMGIAFVAGNLRVGLANAYFMARGRAAVGQLARLSLTSGAATGLAVGLPLFAGLWLSGSLAVLPVVLLAAVCALLPVRIVNVYLNGILRGAGRINAVNVVNHGGTLARALLLIGLATLGIGFDLTTVIWLDVGAVLLATALLWALLSRVSATGADAAGSVGWRDLHRYGGIAFVYMLAQTFNQRIDQIAIAGLLGTGDLAAYAVAIRIATLLWLVVESLQLVLEPQLARLPAAERAGLLCRVNQLLIVVVLGATLVIELSAGWLLELVFGSEFSDAVMPLRVLTVAMALYCGNTLVASWYVASDRLARLSGNVVVLCVVNALCTPLLTLQYGLTGAALGTLIAFSVSTALIVRRFCRDAEVPLRALLPHSPATLANTLAQLVSSDSTRARP